MKKILIFLAGVITGAIGLTLYQLVALPALPDDEYLEWTGELLIYVGDDDETGAWELDKWGRESG